jgi:hypothetical protein
MLGAYCRLNHWTLKLVGDEGATPGTAQARGAEYAESTPPTVARTAK